jgi:hypothetical protein
MGILGCHRTCGIPRRADWTSASKELFLSMKQAQQFFPTKTGFQSVRTLFHSLSAAIVKHWLNAVTFVVSKEADIRDSFLMWHETAVTRQQRHRQGVFGLLTHLSVSTFTHQNAHFHLLLSAFKVTWNNTSTLYNDVHFIWRSISMCPII